jgi:hypothetical protein
MIRKLNFAHSTITLAIVLAFGVTTNAQASEHACSNITLNGSYSALLTGAVGGLPFVTLDLVTADGAGHLTGTSTTNVNGTVTTATIEATYAINADCSGTATFTMPTAQTQSLNVMLNGSSVDITRSGPAATGTLVSGTAHRLW